VVLLEGREHVLLEDFGGVARELGLQVVAMALVHALHALQEEGQPADPGLGNDHLQARMAIEHAAIDERRNVLVDRHGHCREVGLAHTRQVGIGGVGELVEQGFAAADVQADRDVQFLGGVPQLLGRGMAEGTPADRRGQEGAADPDARGAAQLGGGGIAVVDGRKDGKGDDPSRVHGLELGQPVVVALRTPRARLGVGERVEGAGDAGVEHLGVDAVDVHVPEACLGLEGAGSHARVGDRLLHVVLGLHAGGRAGRDGARRDAGRDHPGVSLLHLDHVRHLAAHMVRGFPRPQVGRLVDVRVRGHQLVFHSQLLRPSVITRGRIQYNYWHS
jgi:hypothetical protein